VAVTDRVELAELQPAVARAVDDVRAACRRLGARVVDLPAPWHLDWDDLAVILHTEVWAEHRRYADRLDRYRPAIAELLEAARGFTDAGAYLSAQRRRAAGAAAWEDWLDEHGVDFVLEPTLPIEPYKRGPGYDRGHAGGPGDPMIALTALWDLTGMPVIALPISWSIGISLVARRGGEWALVQAAIDLQEHELGTPRWSAPSSDPVHR
jgi:aspartyl-tRNA(Asn)/glutamyl-tRNA(Gln) amidotransferase subunit A